jgi:GNAT superfamily N-acetyltransferase
MGVRGRPDDEAVPPYPAELAGEIRTTKGAVLHLRPIRPDDAAALVEFHSGLSARSVYRRFFSAHPTLSAKEVARFTHVDYVDRLALIALDEDRLIAVARYERRPDSDEAEVAFVVADEYQHQGVGTLLLERLADAAWRRGIVRFVAETLTENREMLRVFHDVGFPVTVVSESGVTTVRFPIEPDQTYLDARSARHSGPVAAGRPPVSKEAGDQARSSGRNPVDPGPDRERLPGGL